MSIDGPIRCQGHWADGRICRNILGAIDQGAVVVRVRVRSKMSRLIVAPVAAIHCEVCGTVWQPAAAPPLALVA